LIANDEANFASDSFGVCVFVFFAPLFRAAALVDAQLRRMRLSSSAASSTKSAPISTG
jgi:hypothetical protein